MFTRTSIATLTAVIALAATSLLAGAAHASGEEIVSVKVSTRGLDLSSDAGARTMLTRVTRAAREVCGPSPDNRLLDEVAPYRRCVTSTTDRAVAGLANRNVAAANARQYRSGGVALASAR